MTWAGVEAAMLLSHVRVGPEEAEKHGRPLPLKIRPPCKGQCVPVLGLDGTGIKIRGQESSIMVAVDLGSGQPISEVDLEALVAWQAYGVEVIVTDEQRLRR